MAIEFMKLDHEHAQPDQRDAVSRAVELSGTNSELTQLIQGQVKAAMDRKTYMREYMRKRRAKAKDASNG